MTLYRQIYKQIKKYDSIVIAHHIGPDPDALGSSFGLKDVIKKTFPQKKVYVTGSTASKFRYLGIPDKINDDIISKSLLIVVDTPDLKRIDGVTPKDFKMCIKIDHHPFIEKFGQIEWIDDGCSSVSQMIIKLISKTHLKMTKIAAMCLFSGLIADTERFLYDYTTAETFELVVDMIKKTDLNFTSLYEPLYMRPLKDMRFQGYIMSNITVTPNGFGYIKLTNDILTQYGVDAATAGNFINNFNYIDEMLAWGFFSEDNTNNNIRGNIRSRGPAVNDVLAPFGGGGHALASGVKAPNFEVVDEIIATLDKQCQKYKEELDK